MASLLMFSYIAVVDHDQLRMKRSLDIAIQISHGSFLEISFPLPRERFAAFPLTLHHPLPADCLSLPIVKLRWGSFIHYCAS